MRKNYHWLILYDVRNVRRLSYVARIMESYAVRVQKSVFESDADEKTIAVLKNRLECIIDKTEDSVLFLSICEKDLLKCEKYGSFNSDPLQKCSFQIV